MRLLGVLGGMGWSATAEYYRRLNEGVEARLGGLHSARVLIHSVDFQAVDDADAVSYTHLTLPTIYSV